MKSFLSIGGGNLLRQFSTVAGQLYVVRKTGVHAFGELTIAFSLYLLMAGISDFGTRLYCWKTVLSAEMEERPIVAIKMWIIRTTLSFLFLIPIILGVFLLSHGLLKLLLLLYSIGVLANQAAFDWFFLSLNRVTSLFIFNLSSGLLYLLFLLLLVHSEASIYWVPLSFTGSYLLPALVLMGGDFHKHGMFVLFSEKLKFLRLAMKIPVKSYHFFYYDFLQRIYTAFVFIVAWSFYSKSALGEFRVAHLLFMLVSSLSIYLGMSFFNKIHEEGINGRPENRIAHGIAAIFLVILPFSISGFGIISPLARFFMGAQYDMQPLQILVAGLSLPALANFIRETAVAAGHSRVSITSYAFSILITTVLILVYHPDSLSFLAIELLLGELIGLIVLFVFLPFSLLPKISIAVYLVSGVFGGFLWGMEKVLPIMRSTQGRHFQDMEFVPIYCLFFIMYLSIVRKRGIDAWVK